MAKPTELRGLDWINSRHKRAVDILVAAGSLPVAVPLGAAALGLSRAIDGKGAIFRHQRVGQDGQTFTVAKIRTLKEIDPYEINDGVYDEHATRLGKILRLRGLDEIPQLVNVLSGDMSVVGPRVMPQVNIEHMQAELNRTEFDEWFDTYNLSKPGGISTFTLNHRRSEVKVRDWKEKARMDIDDFKYASLGHDLSLLRRATVLGVQLLFQPLPRQTAAESADGSTNSPELA